jgi:hypothetical protein
MKLISQTGGSRLYANDDGTLGVEVRAQLRSWIGEMSAEVYDMPGVGETSTRRLVETLLRQIERDGYEAFGDVEVRVDRFNFVFYLYGDDGHPLVGDDGEYVIDPENPDPLPMVRIVAEVGQWPPAPKVES